MDIEKMLKKKIPLLHEKRDAASSLLRYSLVFILSLIHFELLLRTQIGFNGVILSLILCVVAGAFLGLFAKWLCRVFEKDVKHLVLLLPTAFYIAQIIGLKRNGVPYFMFITNGEILNAEYDTPFKTVLGCIGWILLLLAPILLTYVKKIFDKFVTINEDIKAEIRQYLKYAGIFAAALIYWELLLLTQIGFEGMTLYFLLFIAPWALILAALTGWFKEKFNRILTPVVMALPCVYYTAQFIYYRIFGSLFSVSMMGMAEDAATDFSWALMSTVKESWMWIILCILPVILTVLAAIFVKKKVFNGYRHYLHGVVVLKAIACWVAAALILGVFGTGDGTVYEAYHSNFVDTDTASNRLGALTNSALESWVRFFGSEENEETVETIVPITPPASIDVPAVDSSPNQLSNIDFAALKSKTTNKKIQDLCDYFAAVSPTNKNEFTGKFKDYNLIYICAESYCKYAIHPTVTPTLYKMSQGGIVLNNYYNSYKNTTTNGEFSFMTGLWPDVSRHAKNGTAVGSFAQSSDNLIPFTLGNLFNTKGVKSLAYHNYYGYYYRRSTTHPNLGYTSRFMSNKKGDGGMSFSTRWPASDYEMMQQSVDEFINENQFNVYYMTFSGHGPYAYENPICAKNVEKVRKLVKGENLTEGAKHYLAANMELDMGLEYLLKRLEEAGKLEKTLIVLTGDHYPYYLIDSTYNSLAGEKVEANFGKYESSCIMYCAGMEPIQVDTPCCNVDILPTVLNLFGLEYDSRLLPGQDIFASTVHVAQLYNKSFVTDKVKYNASNGKATWLDAAADMTDDEKKEYLEYLKSLVKSRYAVSLEMMDTDFFRFVMDNS